MTTEGAQKPQAHLDASDQAAMNIAMDGHRKPGFIGPVAMDTRGMQAIQDRANDKAALATAMGSSTRMRVDPEHVEDLARFFEHEAEELQGRTFAIAETASLGGAGHDPVSKGAAKVFGSVAAGDGRSYFENCMKLVDVFKATANNLRASAKQTRTDEQNAEDNLRGGIRA